jgi:hypothetical protein
LRFFKNYFFWDFGGGWGMFEGELQKKSSTFVEDFSVLLCKSALCEVLTPLAPLKWGD